METIIINIGVLLGSYVENGKMETTITNIGVILG